MTDPAAIVPARPLPAGASVHRVERPSPALNRFLYTAVGGDWFWLDRLPWTWDDWARWLDHPARETWLLVRDGVPAGYFELDAAAPPDVEITNFGLLPDFRGQGLGGALLEVALRRGLTLGGRVWVSTCTLDAPHAPAHYRARGLVPFKELEDIVNLPSEPPGPWPGARSRPGGAA